MIHLRQRLGSCLLSRFTGRTNVHDHAEDKKQSRKLTLIDCHLARFQHLQDVILEGEDNTEINYIADKWVKVGYKLQRRILEQGL